MSRFLWLVPLLAGCTSNGLVPLAGVVTLDGRPLAGATLAFVPEGAGQPAVAESAADGSFVARTNGRPGALPGRYHLLVTKDEVVMPAGGEPAGVAGTIDETSSEDLARGMLLSNGLRRRSLLPERYSTIERSPLRWEVTFNGLPQLVIELTSSP
jgi:hypothetical protein